MKLRRTNLSIWTYLQRHNHQKTKRTLHQKNIRISTFCLQTGLSTTRCKRLLISIMLLYQIEQKDMRILTKETEFMMIIVKWLLVDPVLHSSKISLKDPTKPSRALSWTPIMIITSQTILSNNTSETLLPRTTSPIMVQPQIWLTSESKTPLPSKAALTVKTSLTIIHPKFVNQSKIPL